jgi:hypothetical protein
MAISKCTIALSDRHLNITYEPSRAMHGNGKKKNMTQFNKSKAVLLAAFFALLTSGCKDMSRKSDLNDITFHGVTYDFPKEHVSTSVIPPEGRLFVRLSPPNANFHLILDQWGDQPSDQGPDFPRISRLNDAFGKYSLISSTAGPIVCSLGPEPHFNCGIQVEDGPVKWGVLFDKKYVSEAPQIRAQATSLIKSYRSRHAQRT